MTVRHIQQQPPRDDRRVAWFHVPKCASSFGTTLAHYANGSLPDDARILSHDEIRRWRLAPAVTGKFSCEKQLLAAYPPDIWFRGRLWLKGDGNWGNHHAVTRRVLDEYAGHLFGLFREPASRAISSWAHMRPGCSPAAYAKRVEGMATRMLAGQQSFDYTQCCCRASRPPDLALAIRRLEAFRFIGLVEEYALSVCLFHAMLGGPCLPVEFVNMRPGKCGGHNLTEDLARLNGYVDAYDTSLYRRAAQIFWSNIRKYNVSRTACAERVCPNAKGAFTEAGGRD